MNLHFRDPEAAGLYLRNKTATARERLALAEYGFSLRYSDPAAMRAWCDAALINLPTETDAHTAALLYGYAGNSHRVGGEFASAENLLKEALSLCPNSEPLLLEFWSSLLSDLGKLDEASEALSQAARLRRKKREPLPLASTLLQSAIVLDLTEQPDDAARVALRAIKEIASHPPVEKGEELLRTSLQNLALYLTDSGRPQDALLVLRHSRRLLEKGGLRFELRVEWLLARIAGALGDATAREAFVAIRRRFADEQMLQEVALVSLDLARHLLPSSPFEARAEVSSVGPILTQLGISEEAEEFQLLRSILASSQLEFELLTELSRVLYARPRFKNF